MWGGLVTCRPDHACVWPQGNRSPECYGCLCVCPARALLHKDRCHDRLRIEFLVNEKERLLRAFVVRLDAQRICVVPDQASVRNEVSRVDELMEVTKDVEVSPYPFVPLGDRFVGRDVNAANTAAI